ncbi:KUP/HAK/KT family potassium transporter [Kribbella sp. NPDC050124]|uniref:KUP/HAK/KT family potassium transporter n=1 Tax=Kribbella sp. NPDC050124 TaxID=3364114 RepID=UPI0037B93ECF
MRCRCGGNSLPCATNFSSRVVECGLDQPCSGDPQPHPVAASTDSVFGIISLIFWAVTLIVTIKYVLLGANADLGHFGRAPITRPSSSGTCRDCGSSTPPTRPSARSTCPG